MNYDITQVPFSTFGSYMSVSIPSGRHVPNDTPGIYAFGHHNKVHPLFRIAATQGGDEVEAQIEAGPVLLRMSAGAGCVEMCFDGAGTLRMRGRGLGVVFGPCKHAVTYATTDKRMTINVRAATRRYQIECLAGVMNLSGGWRAGGMRTPIRIDMTPDEAGTWEVAIDEFTSTWVPRERAGFDACEAATGERFAKFLAGMPQAPAELAETRELATYVDWASTVEPCGLLHRPAMLMSKNWMCNVWSWDHCFNAMALMPSQPDLAWDQMLLMVDHQDEFGCLPDSVNDIEKHYNFSKPPIHGWTVGEMLRRGPEPSRDLLETMYDSIGRQVKWWLTYRRYEGDVLCYYLHGNDSGWDNGTMFDQGVPLVAPDLAAFLVISCDELANLADRLGRSDDAARWKTQGEEMLAALMSELWRDGRFIALATHAKKPVVCDSLIPCMPILLGKRLPRDVIDALVASLRRLTTEWGLATEHPDSQQYNANGYWRGPVWAPSTYIAVCGLEASGEQTLAREITEKFSRLCAKSGFAENFDAVTGDGLCDRAYTWTSSVFLLLAERL